MTDVQLIHSNTWNHLNLTLTADWVSMNNVEKDYKCNIGNTWNHLTVYKQWVLIHLRNNMTVSYQAIGLMSRVSANGPGDWGSILGWLKKWYLIPPCLTLSIIS